MNEKEYKSWLIGETKAMHGERSERDSKRAQEVSDREKSLPTPEHSTERQVKT